MVWDGVDNIWNTSSLFLLFITAKWSAYHNHIHLFQQTNNPVHCHRLWSHTHIALLSMLCNLQHRNQKSILKSYVYRWWRSKNSKVLWLCFGNLFILRIAIANDSKKWQNWFIPVWQSYSSDASSQSSFLLHLRWAAMQTVLSHSNWSAVQSEIIQFNLLRHPMVYLLG